MVFWWKLSRLLWELSMLGQPSETPLHWCRQGNKQEEPEVSVHLHDCSAVRDGYRLFRKHRKAWAGTCSLWKSRWSSWSCAWGWVLLLQTSWSHSSTWTIQHRSALMTTSQHGEPTRKDVLLDLILTNTKELVRDGEVRGSLGCRSHVMMIFRILRRDRGSKQNHNLGFQESTYYPFQRSVYKNLMGYSPWREEGSRKAGWYSGITSSKLRKGPSWQIRN